MAKKSPVKKKKVIKHLKEDIKMFKHEADEDRKLISSMNDPKPRKKKPRSKKGKEEKISIVMKEFDSGKLRSGSKRGPKVKKRKEAIAIALHEAGEGRKKKREK